MKLSDLTTDQSLNALCEITHFVSNIVKDDEIINTIGKAIDTKKMTKIGVLMAGVDRIAALVPSLLQTHRADVYGVLAAVNMTKPEKIAEQKLTETLAQIDEVLHDEELLTFFRSFGWQAQKAPSSPSAPPPDSAQEDTSPFSQDS